MNKIYKVVWNKARNCYVVASEFAKSHSNSNKRVRSMTAVVAAAMMLTGFGGMAIEAANPASDDTNITIGKGANYAIWNNVTGHDGFTSGYISIGENAKAWDGEYTYKGKYARIGTKEYLLDFNQGAVSFAEYEWSVFPKYRVTDGAKLAGAIAIGKNTMARTGSVMIGDHTYKGQLGDIEVDSSDNSKKMELNNGVYSTTLGTSSYNSGSMATVTGAFSIASGNKYTNDTQNFGATIYGSLNSIESSTTSDSASGMSNSVLGFGNRTQNANASLVWGTGNEVTNSIEDVRFSTNWNKTSASDAQKEIIKAMQSNKYAGGSVMAIGGGNKADWATYSQLLGVRNTLTGTEKDVSKLTMINGYKNTVTNAQNTTIIGSNNTATNIQSTIVMGDHNTLEGRENVISLGNNNTVDANDAVAIGNGTTVKAESGVAIGVGSVADRVADSEKGKRGEFAPDTIPTGEKSTWTSTRGAVSVGDTANNITRQITNVAAGNEDTDAVNVAQLKQVAGQAEKANQGWNLSTNGVAAAATNVAPGNTVDFSGDDNVSVSNKETKVTVALNKDVKLNSATFEDTVINANGLTIGGGTSGLEFSKKRVNVGGQQIHDVADGEDYTDAVNVRQLKQVADVATSNDKRLVQNPNDSDGSYQVKENGDVTLRVEDSNKNGYNVTIKDVASKAELDRVKTDVGNVDGFHDEIKNKDTNGKPTHTSVVDAVNNLDTKVNTIQSDVTKATEEAKKHSSVSTGNGLDLDVTDNNGQKDYKVSLKDDFTLGGKDGHTGSIEFKGSEGNITASGTLTANAVSVGNTSISDTGLQIGNKTSLTEDALTIGGNTYIKDKGIDANQQKISNVADGDISKDSKDAVNGSQLYATNEAIANNYNNITNLNGRISNLDNRVNKVGAGAAALAALHPLDFDPDAKWDFAAGYGNYRGANAAAVGAYYRPNEDTMFSVGGTFGNGENMVNAGVSFKLGSGSSHVSTSRVAMAKEIKELRGELEAMKSAMLDANAGKKIDTSKLQLFPDVPQNHWAYEYVAQLAGNGMIEGYPDGNFAGDRPMTRYEFAAILYRAMTKGAVLSDKILSEFSHELEYFTVDTIAKDKAGNPTIQRVRTVKENKNK